MTNFVFLILIAILAVYDFKYFLIPNKIVAPAIILGCVMTGQVIWAFTMFCLGAYFYKIAWAGGDVKLVTMIGSFMGITSLFVVILYFISMKIYRRYARRGQKIAAVPVFLFSVVVVEATSWCLACAGYIPA